VLNNCTSCDILNLDASTTATDVIYNSYDCELINVKMPTLTKQNSGYLTGGSSRYVESVDHNQVSKALSAWTRGGALTTVSTPVHGVDTQSYQLACVSATAPCFRQRKISLMPGQSITYTAWMQMSASMAWLPRVQIDLAASDSFCGAYPYGSGLASTQIGGSSTSTWYQVSATWTNTYGSPVDVIVRALGMNASGNVFVSGGESVSLSGGSGGGLMLPIGFGGGLE
jgi:hypothetical protein